MCRGPGTGFAASPIRSGIPLLRGTSSEGGSVRGSPCVDPARLRFNLTAPPSCGCYAGNQGPGARQIVSSGTEASERKEFPLLVLFDLLVTSDQAIGSLTAFGLVGQLCNPLFLELEVTLVPGQHTFPTPIRTPFAWLALAL